MLALGRHPGTSRARCGAARRRDPAKARALHSGLAFTHVAARHAVSPGRRSQPVRAPAPRSRKVGGVQSTSPTLLRWLAEWREESCRPAALPSAHPSRAPHSGQAAGIRERVQHDVDLVVFARNTDDVTHPQLDARLRTPCAANSAWMRSAVPVSENWWSSGSAARPAGVAGWLPSGTTAG